MNKINQQKKNRYKLIGTESRLKMSQGRGLGEKCEELAKIKKIIVIVIIIITDTDKSTVTARGQEGGGSWKRVTE